MSRKTCLALAVSTLFSASAMANISVNVGAITVQPNDSSSYLNVVETVASLPANSTEATVNGNTQLGITVDYAIDNNWTVELIAATPFSHDVEVKSSVAGVNGLNIGSVKHLPPTLLAQYHFGEANAAFRPFIGAGVNYTLFFSEDVDAELTNTLVALGAATANDKVSLKLDDSFGLAVQAGFNYKLDDHWGVHAMVAYANIDTDAEVRVNGVAVQPVTVHIDPTIFMIGARYSF